MHEQLATELVRALRGRLSRPALSARLGYRSNVVGTWERGRRFPTAAELFAVARLREVDLQAGLELFFRDPPSWLSSTDLTTRQGVCVLMYELRAGARVSELAERSGANRFAVARWLKGHTEPRLPEFLRLVEAMTLRLLDFVAIFADPGHLPSVADEWAKLEAHRRVAYELPWSQAVLRALETERYRTSAAPEPGFIADMLGITLDEEHACLEALEATGHIRRSGAHWVPTDVRTIDTRRNRRAGHQLRCYWAQIGVDRMRNGADGQYAYNVFTCSEDDLARIGELQRQFYAELRQIVAQSKTDERVVLANLHLVPLDRPPLYGGSDDEEGRDRPWQQPMRSRN